MIGLAGIRRPGEDLKVNMVAAATSIIAGWGGAMPTVDSSWPALSGASTGPLLALTAVLNGDLCPVAPCGTRYGKLGWWRPFWGRQAMTSAAGIGISAPASNMLRQFQVLLSIKVGAAVRASSVRDSQPDVRWPCTSSVSIWIPCRFLQISEALTEDCS